MLDDIYRRVEDGSTLGEAMSRYPRVFSEMAINMVRAGGEGGFLEDALERVSQFTEQQEDLKSRTAGALAYPVFLAIVGTLVVGGLVIFFVPAVRGDVRQSAAAGRVARHDGLAAGDQHRVAPLWDHCRGGRRGGRVS